jgi:hypothetical protein
MPAEAGAIAAAATSYCLFQDPWWLNLTTEGNWDEVQVSNAAGVIARLPYRTLRRYGATILTQPPLTPYAGPWFRPSSAKAANQFSERRQLTAELLGQLPRCDLFTQSLWPEIPDWLPFYWAGFSQSTQYTHWLRELANPTLLWEGFLEATRREIRKAQRSVAVVVSNDVERLCELHELAFTQRGRKPPRARAFLRRVVEGALASAHGRIVLALDEQGNAHAANLIVFDERSAHYLIGGSDVRYRSSGAASLLMWDAIEFAARTCRLFDFEGSMNEGVARFFRGFNPQCVAVSHVQRLSRRATLATALCNAGAALLGRPPLRF